MYLHRMMTCAALCVGVILGGPVYAQQADPCAKYYGKGYCTDYIRTKLGSRTPRGNAINYPISGTTPKVGSVAVFSYAMPFGHVAWVESVDTKKKTFRVSHWNFGSKMVNARCAVTDKFGVRTETTFPFGHSKVVGFYYPARR